MTKFKIHSEDYFLFYLSLLFARMAYFALHTTGLSAGTSIIGKFVLKLDPHFLSECNRYIDTKINVTGTNGKGSTSYYLSNLLQKAGQKTGLFVSPYIYEFNERIQLNGKKVFEIKNKYDKIFKKRKIGENNVRFCTLTYT